MAKKCDICNKHKAASEYRTLFVCKICKEKFENEIRIAEEHHFPKESDEEFINRIEEP